MTETASPSRYFPLRFSSNEDCAGAFIYPEAQHTLYLSNVDVGSMRRLSFQTLAMSTTRPSTMHRSRAAAALAGQPPLIGTPPPHPPVPVPPLPPPSPVLSQPSEDCDTCISFSQLNQDDVLPWSARAGATLMLHPHNLTYLNASNPFHILTAPANSLVMFGGDASPSPFTTTCGCRATAATAGS